MLPNLSSVEVKRPIGRKRKASLKAYIPFCLLLSIYGVHAGEPEPLRLCADPDNLPFSSERADTPGLYREIGDAIAHELNRSLTEVWYRTNFGKRATRVTLLAKQCDLFVGLPADRDFMGPAVIFSKPIMQAGYALVTKKPSETLSLTEMNGRSIAVQFSTPPQSLLANYDGIRMVTRLSPEEGIEALASGEADAAFVWGPAAGYLNKTQYGNAFNIVPIDGPGMQWPVAIGFAKANGALRDEVNGVLDKIAGKIAELEVKYGIPTAAPVKLATHASAETRAPALIRVAGAGAEAAAPATTVAIKPAEEPAAKPEAGGTTLIAEGKEIFNGTCAHCHGPNAEQAERKIDLRLLHHRYRDRMEETFFKTVINGRPSKGMPSWKEVFTQDQFKAIFAYLKTKQSD